jgi:hypothetical protein
MSDVKRNIEAGEQERDRNIKNGFRAKNETANIDILSE